MKCLRDEMCKGGKTMRNMKNTLSYAEINSARIPVDANVGGMIFAASTVIIFILGIPLIRYLFPAAIVAGSGIAFILHRRK
jgi:hypothetical protein